MKGSGMPTQSAPRIVGPSDGRAGSLGSIGVRFMIGTGETHDGGFSLVEHPMPPRALAAPLHRHSREDEYSYVLEGRMGALLGDDVVQAGAGDLVHKPRGQWHTVWNAGDEPCRILEIISPGGFERYFAEIVDAAAAGPLDPEWAARTSARYGLEIDAASIPGLCERFGLTFGPLTRS
jgi:mannose-6-phosphate isomerase-like protein (cupin superfamily)